MTRCLQFGILALTVTGALADAGAQSGSPARSAYTQSWEDMLHRATTGHSPTPEEIAAAGSPSTQPDADAVAQALPTIRKALADPDTTVRTYALTALTGLELAPPAPDAPSTTPPPAATPARPDAPVTITPSAFPTALASILLAAVPEIGKNLADEDTGNRILAATALGGFSTNPQASVYRPLLAYLKRDDGTGPTGVAVVDDLLQLGPISAETADAVIRYLRRSDQTADSRSGLIDSVANHQNHSQAIDKALLGYLNTDDSAVRARLILSLPLLDLSSETFADTHARVAILAANDQENLQVVNAAKAVEKCWTASRMAAGCPVY